MMETFLDVVYAHCLNWIKFFHHFKNFHGGLFTENCFVLGQGYYQDGVFHIEHLGMPPPEPAKVTRYSIIIKFLLEKKKSNIYLIVEPILGTQIFSVVLVRRA